MLARGIPQPLAEVQCTAMMEGAPLTRPRELLTYRSPASGRPNGGDDGNQLRDAARSPTSCFATRRGRTMSFLFGSQNEETQVLQKNFETVYAQLKEREKVVARLQAEAATLIANMFRGRAARKALDPALAKQAKSKRGAVAKKMAGTNIPEGADEITLLQGCFEEADGNGDGVVDFDEFCAVMEALSAQTGKRYSAMQLKAMFAKVDVDNSGTIEHSDFLNVRATHLSSLHEPSVVLLLPKDV